MIAYPAKPSYAESAKVPLFDWLMPLAPWEEPEILRQTLISLLEQTWQARALVVSVDGLLSDSLQAVLRASGLPLEVHQSERWEGAGPVLARGLLACKSEIVLRVDADDRSVPERSRWQVELMLADPDLAVLGGQLEEIWYNGSEEILRRRRLLPLAKEEVNALSRWRNPINHPTVALRRSMVLCVGNYRSCLYFEDWDLWLRLLKYGMVIRNDYRVLVFARVGANHLSRRTGIHYLRCEFLFLLRALRSSLIPFPYVLFLVFARLPLRLLPKQVLNAFTALFLRKCVLPIH